MLSGCLMGNRFELFFIKKSAFLKHSFYLLYLFLFSICYDFIY